MEEALANSPAPLSILAQERLSDPAFVPALVRGAVDRFGVGKDAARCVLAGGMCVTGLPATWASDPTKARALGAHLREAWSGYSGIRVIPEPLGLVYAETLDNHGQVTGAPALLESWLSSSRNSACSKPHSSASVRAATATGHSMLTSNPG
jgi:hypothetical protein